jgi:serine/threonine protein kinase
MEYCEYGDLRNIIEKIGRGLSEIEIQSLLPSVLEGLVYLHSVKYVYQSLKCKKILVDSNFQVKLTNFGISSVTRIIRDPHISVLGVPYWMAPEQIREYTVSPTGDVWSLGITVIEMAEENPPWSDVHPMRVLFLIPSRPAPTFKSPETRSEILLDFVTKCLDKVPSLRPTVEELLLHSFITTSPTESVRRDAVARFVNDSIQSLPH